MSYFSGYLNQAKHNIKFLESIQNQPNIWDWKVTISFYTALHLINAHIEWQEERHYLSHTKVDAVINPYGNSIAKLPENYYLSYQKLYNLSRRSRYLVSEKTNIRNTEIEIIAHKTHDIHFQKTLIHLDLIIEFMIKKYNLKDFPKIQIIENPILRKSNFKNIKLIKTV